MFIEVSSPPDKLPEVIEALEAPAIFEEEPCMALPFSAAVFILLTCGALIKYKLMMNKSS